MQMGKPNPVFKIEGKEMSRIKTNSIAKTGYRVTKQQTIAVSDEIKDIITSC